MSRKLDLESATGEEGNELLDFVRAFDSWLFMLPSWWNGATETMSVEPTHEKARTSRRATAPRVLCYVGL